MQRDRIIDAPSYRSFSQVGKKQADVMKSGEIKWLRPDARAR